MIPPGFERKVSIGQRVPVQVIINGDDSNTAATVMGYSLRILQTVSVVEPTFPGLSEAEGRSASGSPSRSATGQGVPMITVEPRVWYNPELRSALFLVPGLIAYIGMISSVVSTSLSVVREKERGTMEQVRMAPLGTTAYIVGKTLPYFCIAMCSSMGIILASMVLFGLPMNGSWLLLLLSLSLYLTGALGLGLMISTAAESQQAAFQLALLASFLPTMMLSGFVYPIASMPAPIRAITYLVPARYFLVALRSIVLKGAGIHVFWMQLVALTIYAAVMLTMASRRLKRSWA